jgi:hypothetical protein
MWVGRCDSHVASVASGFCECAGDVRQSNPSYNPRNPDNAAEVYTEESSTNVLALGSLARGAWHVRFSESHAVTSVGVRISARGEVPLPSASTQSSGRADARPLLLTYMGELMAYEVELAYSNHKKKAGGGLCASSVCAVT